MAIQTWRISAPKGAAVMRERFAAKIKMFEMFSREIGALAANTSREVTIYQTRSTECVEFDFAGCAPDYDPATGLSGLRDVSLYEDKYIIGAGKNTPISVNGSGLNSLPYGRPTDLAPVYMFDIPWTYLGVGPKISSNYNFKYVVNANATGVPAGIPWAFRFLGTLFEGNDALRAVYGPENPYRAPLTVSNFDGMAGGPRQESPMRDWFYQYRTNAVNSVANSWNTLIGIIGGDQEIRVDPQEMLEIRAMGFREVAGATQVQFKIAQQHEWPYRFPFQVRNDGVFMNSIPWGDDQDQGGIRYLDEMLRPRINDQTLELQVYTPAIVAAGNLNAVIQGIYERHPNPVGR